MKISLATTLLFSLLCIAVLFSVSTNSRNSILVKEYAYVAVGALAAAVMSVLILAGSRLHLNRIPKSAAFALPLIAILMMMMHVAGPITSVNGPFAMASFVALSLLGVLGVAVLDGRNARLLALLLTVMSSLVFIYAMLQWLGLRVFPWDSGLTRLGRASGSLGNPNLLGSYAAAMIPFGAASILSRKGGYLKVMLAIAFSALAVLAVVASGTRGSLFGVAGGVFFMGAWLFSRRNLSPRSRFVVVIAALAVIVLAVLPLRTRLMEISVSGDQTGTAQVRGIIWEGGFSMFRDRPLLGWGPGSFQIVFPAYRNPYYSVLGVSHNTLHAHCEYLEILCDIGIAGLLLWGVFAVSMAKRMKGAGLLSAGAAAGAVSMLTENLVSVSLRWPPTSWLFAMLCVLFLVREGTPSWKPGKAAKALYALGFGSVSVVLGVFAFTAYPRALDSARLVFIGKDYHLTSTEPAMEAATVSARTFASTGDPSMASATANAWMTATVHADSAIALCTRAMERNPQDLGAYYALGSAYLMRALIADPTDRNIATALDHAGLRGSNPEAARSFNARGMEIYADLTVLAPNYAETHNNMAIGYLTLGDLRASLDHLYLAWRLHGHRRVDYLTQTRRLLRIVPDSHSGAMLVWSHLLKEMREIQTEENEGKRVAKLLNNSTIAWFLIQASDHPDSLYESFRIISEESCPGLWITIDSVYQSLYSPSDIYADAMELVRSGRDQEGLDLLYTLHQIQLQLGTFTPTLWPGLGMGYSVVPGAARRLEWSHDGTEAVFDQMVLLYQSEHLVDAALELSRYPAVRSTVRDSLTVLLNNLGGPRAAIRSSRNEPWLDGSMLAGIEGQLDSLRLSDTENASYPVLQARFYFLAVTSLWWDSPYFTSGHNDYILTRLFESRDRAAALLGSNATPVLSRALDSELQRVADRLDSRSMSVMDDLKRDLALLVPR